MNSKKENSGVSEKSSGPVFLFNNFLSPAFLSDDCGALIFSVQYKYRELCNRIQTFVQFGGLLNAHTVVKWRLFQFPLFGTC